MLLRRPREQRVLLKPFLDAARKTRNVPEGKRLRDLRRQPLEVRSLLLHPFVEMAVFRKGLHGERIFKRGDRHPFARQVQPVTALVPYPVGMAGQERPYTTRIVLG